jgi:WD40 repeat protein
MRQGVLLRILVALVLGVMIGTIIVLLLGRGEGAPSNSSNASQRAMVLATGLPAAESVSAARLALAGDRLDPGPAGEIAMLEVALGSAGVERVIQTGARRVTAAIRLEHLLLTADSHDLLRVWRPATGTLIGQARTSRPLTMIGEAQGMPLAAGADSAGRLWLLDLSDPHHPRLLPVRQPVGAEPVLAIAFSEAGATVLAIRADGELERFRTSDGRLLERRPLLAALGGLPHAGSRQRLRRALFELESTGPPRQILLGFADGAVARVSVGGKGAKLLLPPGQAPGPITSIAAVPYGGEVAIGTVGGLVTLEHPASTATVQAGPPVAGVAFNAEDELLVASKEGVTRESAVYSKQGPYGSPALGLSVGHGGVVALAPGGAVSVLGPLRSGLGLPEASESSAVSFLPGGGLVLADGWAADHIERLIAVRPGHEKEEWTVVTDPEIRSYEPDPGWWPQDEEEEEQERGLYVNDITSDSEFIVAGGQDPTGEAVVLVWDARSGNPVRRLPLATGGLNPNEPSIVAEVALAPAKHLLAAYSAVQQMVAIWSTESWKLLATVPVGRAGDLALEPDESAFVASGISEDEEDLGSGTGTSKLIYIDTTTKAIDHEVKVRESDRAAFSPDGQRLAVLGLDGTLRIRSADGHKELRPPIHLDGQPLALSWRPDGNLIAVALNEIGIVLVDPRSGHVSPPLPEQPSTSVFGLDWSADGRFLAAAPATAAEEGEYFEPESVEIWALDGPRLQRRMCQLSGGPIEPSEWAKAIGHDIPYQRLCRTHLNLPSSPAREEKIVLGSMAFAPNGLGWGRMEPEQIFNGGDPSGLVTDIYWKTWGGPVATGYGQTSIFKPHGGYYPGKVQIELRAHDIGRCGFQPTYTQLAVRAPTRPHGHLGPWGTWSDTSELCGNAGP